MEPRRHSLVDHRNENVIAHVCLLVTIKGPAPPGICCEKEKSLDGFVTGHDFSHADPRHITIGLQPLDNATCAHFLLPVEHTSKPNCPDNSIPSTQAIPSEGRRTTEVDRNRERS